MKNWKTCVLAICCFAALACNPCNSLRKTDDKISAKFDKLNAKFEAGKLDTAAFKQQLTDLRERELELFETVKSCDLTEDRTEHNYWYRARMKFPSQVEMKLQRLEMGF